MGFVDTDRTDETEDNESKMTGTSDGAQSEEGAESFIDDEKSEGEEWSKNLKYLHAFSDK